MSGWREPTVTLPLYVVDLLLELTECPNEDDEDEFVNDGTGNSYRIFTDEQERALEQFRECVEEAKRKETR